jgi:MFS family permease
LVLLKKHVMKATTTTKTSETPPASSPGAWAPLGVRVFRWLWLAALCSNIGTWIHEVAAGWFMTGLSDSRLMVALVQAATMGPVFLLALPAGALADVVDRRRLLIAAQIWNFLAAGALAVLTLAGLVTPGMLLALVALLALGTSMHMPAFQAIVPDLVPRVMLKSAVTLNGVSINLARAIGPALAGLIISSIGIWAAFAMNAVTFLAVLAVVFFWKPTPRTSKLPPEHLVRAVLVGLRYARHDRPLQIVLARAMAFMTCASAAWALLPVVIRSELGRSSGDYGIALAVVGVGAISGALLLPRFGKRWSADVLVVAATLIYAVGLLAMALVHEFWILLPFLVGLGVAWLTMMATLNASAQTVLPDWVRARGLSVFLLVFAGSMAGGAAIWGFIADMTSTGGSLITASAVAATGCLLAPLLPLRTGEFRNLAPTQHMPPHPDPEADADDTGEVQVLVFYDIAPENEPAFQAAMRDVRNWRLRTGAFVWMLYPDHEPPGTWLADS